MFNRRSLIKNLVKGLVPTFLATKATANTVEDMKLPFNITPDFVKANSNTEGFEKFIKIYPNGCVLNNENITSLLEADVDILDMGIPINGCIVYNGIERHYENGKLHRLDGPAFIKYGHYESWYKNGRHHRIGGPASSNKNKSECWYKDGLLHREEGPAMIFPDGKVKWYKNGNYIGDGQTATRLIGQST